MSDYPSQQSATGGLHLLPLLHVRKSRPGRLVHLLNFTQLDRYPRSGVHLCNTYSPSPAPMQYHYWIIVTNSTWVKQKNLVYFPLSTTRTVKLSSLSVRQEWEIWRERRGRQAFRFLPLSPVPLLLCVLATSCPSSPQLGMLSCRCFYWCDNHHNPNDLGREGFIYFIL